MFNIGDYLKKFSSYKTKKEELFFVFKQVAKDNKIDLGEIKVTHKNRNFYVDCSNTIKNQLFIKKTTIIDELKRRGVVIEDIL